MSNEILLINDQQVPARYLTIFIAELRKSYYPNGTKFRNILKADCEVEIRPDALTRIEKAVKSPDIAYLYRFAKCIKVKPTHLLDAFDSIAFSDSHSENFSNIIKAVLDFRDSLIGEN